MEETQDPRNAEQAPGAQTAKSNQRAEPAEPVEPVEPAARTTPRTAHDPARRTADALGRLLPDRAAEDEPAAWGDPSDDPDARFLDDVPPHHGG